MSDPSLAILIVEDDHHERLIRRYLQKRGMKGRIRVESSPSGTGSAEQWVRKTFVKEVSVCRKRHAKTALVVVVDADSGTVHGRLKQLDQALQAAGTDPIDSANEQIARLVPKRNIETWILCLNSKAVDEVADYRKGSHWGKLIPQAAETLLQWTQSSEAPPPSA